MNSTRHTFLLALGVVVALTMFASQAGLYQLQTVALTSEQTEKKLDLEDKSEQSGEVVYSNDAISTAVSLNVTHALHFIQDILSAPVENSKRPFSILESPSKYFLTLFRRIISPNAP